jgi:hypothetical protein
MDHIRLDLKYPSKRRAYDIYGHFRQARQGAYKTFSRKACLEPLLIEALHPLS